MIVSATGWSPKRAATRWRWWSCRGVEAPESWLAASCCPARELFRASIEDHFRQRIAALPEATQRLMLLAAADPVGDATLLWRAAATLGVERQAAEAAAGEQLLEIGAQVRFRHPLVRSAAYRAASLTDRRAVHGALAAATDPETDPDRRAWHRAHAAIAPDEEVAGELIDSASRAQAPRRHRRRRRVPGTSGDVHARPW